MKWPTVEQLRSRTVRLPNGARISVVALAMAVVALISSFFPAFERIKDQFKDAQAAVAGAVEKAQASDAKSEAAAREAQAVRAENEALRAQIAPLQDKVTAGTATATDVTRLRELVTQLQANKGAAGPPGSSGPPGPPGPAGAGGATSTTTTTGSTTTTTTRPGPSSTTTTTRPRPSTTTTTRPCLVSLPGVAKVGC